ncbi:cyclic AMP-responsive element-binding protein 3-like protein 4 isoform X1 [Anguilla anguilla]|uniref:cyclic AMP-responsive element-binding protein 3-like protein 4 isoform X1 n=2 Tax=Anguilla anguilla TaxID=7936 RepID=UPI0015AF547A|nr:cyclic AMP-responsive element-binding protein 3-like protein 4 isoform X1 [Anguilla anguilla]
MDVCGYVMEMDAENGEVFFGQRDEEGVVDGALGVEELFSSKTLEEWALEPHCGLNDSETEDVLHAINPNDVFPSGPAAESLSESDSGISEDPCSEPPSGPSEPFQGPPTIYQVVYDISSLSTIKAEPEQHNVDVISIELDQWSSQMLISESCIVNELPVVPTAKSESVLAAATIAKDDHSLDDIPLYPELRLTEEEQKLLNQEGISLPNNLPLTKAEERILKKVRRKIRNKQSAQDSRRRKKEYIDGLESRVAACSVQNQELQKTVDQLEKHNVSLLAQLRRLQSLIKHTATKAAQTSTCILIFLFSLALIIFPSYSPFSWDAVSVEEGYAPTGVISRNILTDPASSVQVSEDTDSPALSQDNTPPFSPDPGKADSLELNSGLQQQIMDSPEMAINEGLAQEQSEPRNVSNLVEGRTDPLALGLISAEGQGSANVDPTKPAHADEM